MLPLGVLSAIGALSGRDSSPGSRMLAKWFLLGAAAAVMGVVRLTSNG